MPTNSRTDRILAAVQARISRQGDMPIRISTHTLQVLLNACGIRGWELGCDQFREIDAVALDARRHIAWMRR